MSIYLIMMGVQGAGKGTQAAFLSDKYGIPHVSTGDLFRAMKTREDDFAKSIQQIMASGQLISDETTNEILRERLEQPDAANGVILDGYPRTVAQAEWLENYLYEQGEKLSAVLVLEIDFFTAFKRAFGRVKSDTTEESYNIFFHTDEVEYTTVEHPDKAFPPRLEATLKATGEKLSRRPDDEAFSVVKRIDTYVETTQPLVDYYTDKGLVITIDASQSVEAVTHEIVAAVEKVKV